MKHRTRAEERHAETKGEKLGLIAEPISFRSAADDYEDWLEREYEKARDWLTLARHLNARGIVPRDWPTECFAALVWIAKHERVLVLVGLRLPEPIAE